MVLSRLAKPGAAAVAFTDTAGTIIITTVGVVAAGAGTAGAVSIWLDASPAQERAIINDVDKLHERLHAAKVNMKDGRADLAAAVRSETLDDAALGAVLGRVDNATAEARTAALEALRNIHAVLDERQREQLASVLEGGWWGRGTRRGPGGGPGGPYRV